MILCCILTILAASCVFAYGQRIKMMPYRQEDSETNCTHGLTSDVDTAVFKAEVDLSGDVHMRYVYFQRKSKTDSEFLFFKGIVTNASVADKNSWTIISPNVAQFTIKDKAKVENSGARIRGVLVTSDYNEFVSEQQIYPDIRESNDLKIKLLINGLEKPIQNNVCDIHATGANVVIIYECQSQALPCLIEITSNDLMKPLLGRGYVLHTSELPELNITIKYATCTLNGKVNTISCHITRDVDIDTKTTQEENNTATVPILSTIIAILVIVIIIWILITVLRRCYRKQLLKDTMLTSHIKRRTMLYPKVSRDMTPKRKKSFIEGNNLESCRSYNSPLINNGVNVIDSNVDKETDEEEVTHQLISTADNLKNTDNGFQNLNGPMSIVTMESGNEDGEKDTDDIKIEEKPGTTREVGPFKLRNDINNEGIEKQSEDRLMPTKGLASKDTDNGFQNLNGPMSILTMVCGNEDGEKDKDDKKIENKAGKIREAEPLKLHNDKSNDSCGLMQEETKGTDETIPHIKEFITTSEDNGKDDVLSVAKTIKEPPIELKDLCEIMKEEAIRTIDLRTKFNQDIVSSVPGSTKVIGRIVELKPKEDIMQTLKILVKRS